MLAAVVSLAVAGCSRRRVAPPTPVGAVRVVSVAPSTTEALFAIGAGHEVVGRSRFCDWPPEAMKLPVIGGWVDVDLEAILQLLPDLVVGASGPSSVRLADALGARGIATWFPEVDSLASIDAMILGLGERTGRSVDARKVRDEIDARTAALGRAVAAEPAPRVLTVLGLTPVVAAGPGSFLDELVRRARGANVLTGGGPWQTLGVERLVELDPDVVLDASMGSDAGPSRITARAPGWADLRAVREGRVVSMDERVPRPGPRVAESLAQIARTLHPRAVLPAW